MKQKTILCAALGLISFFGATAMADNCNNYANTTWYFGDSDIDVSFQVQVNNNLSAQISSSGANINASSSIVSQPGANGNNTDCILNYSDNNSNNVIVNFTENGGWGEATYDNGDSTIGPVSLCKEGQEGCESDHPVPVR